MAWQIFAAQPGQVVAGPDMRLGHHAGVLVQGGQAQDEMRLPFPLGDQVAAADRAEVAPLAGAGFVAAE